MTYRMRGMPRRFMEGAPDIVRKGVVDIIRIVPPAPLDFDIVLREGELVPGSECVGLDFHGDGVSGCHFFLKPHEMRAYRERNRRKRVAWKDLPRATRNAIVAYLKEPA